MERFVRSAIVLLIALTAFSAWSDDRDLVSTRCREVELPLDGKHSVSLLAGCGEEYPEDLLWHLDRIDQIAGTLDGRFDRQNRGAGSVVYVMDTGILADHIEFVSASGQSRVIAGFDTSSVVPIGASRCRSSNKALAPCFSNFDELTAASHGTSVASILGGRRVGVAPSAQIVSVRVMNERGLATTRSYLDGLNAIIHHAFSAGAPQFRTAVVNISGWVLEQVTPGFDVHTVSFANLEQKIRDMVGGVDANGRPDANGRKFFFVVAANNIDGGCGLSGYVDRFPAVLGKRIDGVITVGGMTAENSWWYGSCRGDIEVLAPAKGIFSATITGRDHYRGKRPNLRSGTSFAAPIISGIAARLLADRPDLTPAELEAWISSTPSRIDNAAAAFADGKVGYCESIALPRPMISTASAEGGGNN
ncbi:MAG TPA: S8 family serine peptidase [Thermoanaerobaculia bacterium]